MNFDQLEEAKTIRDAMSIMSESGNLLVVAMETDSRTIQREQILNAAKNLSDVIDALLELAETLGGEVKAE